jgi:hypothetical protein
MTELDKKMRKEDIQELRGRLTLRLFASFIIGTYLYPAGCIFEPTMDDIPDPKIWMWFGIFGIVLIILSFIWYFVKKNKLEKYYECILLSKDSQQ